jgi:uncharacterized protein YbjT (DUF2867 family)
MILVTGATGKQGGATAAALLGAGHMVRVMTRSPESEPAKRLAAAGAEVVLGDFNDEVSLTAALEGAWGAFAVQDTWTAGVEQEEEQGKRFATLARAAGVQHFVYTSVASAHRNTGIPHFENKWRVEETIRGLGFPSHVILRPVYFMENLNSPWVLPGLEEGVLNVGITPDTTLQMIATRDIGLYAFKAFEDHEAMAGQEIDIAGDELTMPETARILGEVMGKKITHQPTPIDQVRSWSEDFALMLEWFDKVGYDVDIAGNATRYGVRPTTLTEWAASVEWPAMK